MVILGEVHTGLVQHATPLSLAQCQQVLSLRKGEVVLHSTRPTAHAVSPEVLTGVDCLLPSRTGAKVRGAGTVSTRMIIVGGRILQGSSHTTVVPGDSRQFWSHYLARPGNIEAIGKIDPVDVRRGYIMGRPVPQGLDIGAITASGMAEVQRSDLLDLRPPIRAPRTCLRWTLTETGDQREPARGVFTARSDMVRTLDLVAGECDLGDAVALCEDLALHDWLLTTLTELLNIAQGDSRPAAERIARLSPAIEHLLHLWMPAARVTDDLMPVWEEYERRPGFSRQWNALVAWIRDQVSVTTMTMLHAATTASADHALRNT